MLVRGGNVKVFQRRSKVTFKVTCQKIYGTVGKALSLETHMPILLIWSVPDRT